MSSSQRAYSQAIVYLHDPAAMAIALDPSLVTDCCQGGVAVATDGIMKVCGCNVQCPSPPLHRTQNPPFPKIDTVSMRIRCVFPFQGHTILDNGKKNWVGENPWMARPKTKVYLAADSEKIKQRCIQLLSSL